MNEQQEVEIRVLLGEQMSDQMKMLFTLWNQPAMRDLIRRWFGLMLTLQGVGLYLTRWSFTPQKSIKRVSMRSGRKQYTHG